MAAPFVNTGSPLKSTHRAAAFIEAMIMLQNAESALPADTAPNNVSVSYDLEARTVTADAALPVATVISSTGQPTLQAQAYLVAAFVPGTSDVKSDTLPEAVLELAYMVNASELLIPEATRPNNISISIADDVATISFTGPITYSLDGTGKTLITTSDYL